MSLNSLNSTTLVATWEEPEILNGVLEGYRLQLTLLQSIELPKVVDIPAELHQYTWTGLHPYYSYEVSVAAFNSAGRGQYYSLRVQMPESGKCVFTRIEQCDK